MSNQVKYRPEIDGLRTIAVFSVILYHANFLYREENIIPGGFLGVDIFFVISGYLITRILIKGFSEKTLRFFTFYERRARRILPILLLVMTVSLPFSWFILSPSDFKDYSYQLISGILSVSNFYFWLENPYWATESALKPFLHTWSLGVEEQFYFLMPLFVFVLVQYRPSRLIFWFVVLAAISLIIAHLASLYAPQSAFYLLPFRAWELLAGSILATLNTRHFPQKLTFAPSLGLLLILGSFFVFNENTTHPSFLTVIPILGTAMIIYFANDRDPATRILKQKYMVYLGLISYGLYIWHFPIFAYLNHYQLLDELSIKIIAIAAVVALSSTTYFFFERQFRNFAIISSKVFISIISIWIVLLLGFAAVGTQSGFKARFPELINVPSRPAGFLNHKWFLSDKDEAGRLILVGDSHINAIAPVFRDWALDNGFDFAKSGFGACQLILNMNRVSKDNYKKHKHCFIETQNNRLEFIQSSEPAIIVIGGRLPLVVEEDRFDNQEGGYEGEMPDLLQNEDNSLSTQAERQAQIAINYYKTVDAIIKAGHKVVLLYPIPEVGIHVPKTLIRRINGDYQNAKSIAENNPVTTSHQVFKTRNQKAYEILDSIKGPNISRIYPEQLFCNTSIKDRCITHDSNASFYRDDDHLSSHGAALLLPELQKIIQSLK